MSQMKKTAAAVALAALSMQGAQATALAAGDFAFTGINVNTTVGGWSFVSFVDMAAGTTIFFTDTNHLQTPTAAGVFSSTAESFWTWTATTDIAAGTSIATHGTGTSGAFTVSSGSIASANGAAYGISSGGDTFYAYQAPFYATNYQPGDITFIGALSSRATPYPTSDNPAATGLTGVVLKSYYSPGITRYTEFVPQTTTDDTPYASMDDLKSALADTSNWISISASNSVAVSHDVLAVPETSTYAMLLAGLGLIGTMARRRTRA